jgi:hypothetical protein
MTSTESSTHADEPRHDRDRDRELVRAINDALILAVGQRAARRTRRRARTRAQLTTQHRAVRTVAHLAGYSALLGYIWHQRRASHHPAA